MAGHKGPKPKKVTPAKMRRAIEAMDDLLICADLDQYMNAHDRAFLVAAKRSLNYIEDQ